MKMLVFNSSTVKPHQVAVSPNGQLIVLEVGDGKSLIRTPAGEVEVDQEFDRIVNDVNAELEMWR